VGARRHAQRAWFGAAPNINGQTAALLAPHVQKLIEELADVSKMDAPLALRPSNFSVTLSPLK
jgi:hypothetical protein